MNTLTVAREEDQELVLEHLYAIEGSCGPKVESALLMDYLKRSLQIAPGLADPAEVHNYHNPLASLNAYKQRMQAVRCEYVAAHLRTIELEEELAEARLRILRLEARAQHLELTLQSIHSSRVWQIRERCARSWRMLSQWLRSRDRNGAVRTTAT
jgi:hypothetical protein